jgi:hypothetical protein
LHTLTKEILVKKVTAIAFSVLAVLTTAGSAMAQGAVRATIPFDFTVDNKTLPAGNYEVTQSLGSFIRIQNLSHPEAVALVAAIRDSMGSHDKSVMVFVKYGDHYFLHNVFSPAVINVSLYRSKEERQISRQTAMLDNANTVLVAVK